MHEWPIVPDHGTQMKKIHPAIMEECTRMDIQMDRQIGGLDTFPRLSTPYQKWYVMLIPNVLKLHKANILL